MALQDAGNLSEAQVRSGGTDSGGSGESYPKFRAKTPFIALVRQDDGSLQPRFQPDDLQITYKKRTEHASWELSDVPESFEKYWETHQEFQRTVHIVREELGRELPELMREFPEAALRCINKAAQSYKTDHSVSEVRDCRVCGKTLHLANDNYVSVLRSWICPEHTVEELKDSGLIE